MPRTVLLAALALAGVIVSVGMVLLGLPEANAAQTVLLELSSLPLSASVGVGIVLLRDRAVREPGRRALWVLLTGAVLVLLGLVLVVWAYVLGPRDIVHTGQALIWLGLFAALVVMVRLQPRARHTQFRLDDPDEADSDDEPADPDLDRPASI